MVDMARNCYIYLTIFATCARSISSFAFPENSGRRITQTMGLAAAADNSLLMLDRPQKIRSDDDGEVAWDETLLDLEKWAASKGADFSERLVHAHFPGPLRGLMAVRDLEEWETLVALPLEALLAVEGGPDAPPKPVVRAALGGGGGDGGEGGAAAAAAGRWWARAPWFLRLAAALLAHRALGEGSEFHAYIKALPSEFDTIIHWTDTELTILEYPQLLKARKVQIRQYHRFYKQFTASLAENAPLKNVTYKEFEWALEVVLSRAFQLPPNANAESAQEVEVVAGDGAAPLPGGGGGGRWGAAAAGGEGAVYALLPVLDALNHYSKFATDMGWDARGRLTVRTEQRYDKGDHVFISYGQRSNDELMQYYGFCEHENPTDEYVILNRQQSASLLALPAAAAAAPGWKEEEEEGAHAPPPLPRHLHLRKDGVTPAGMHHLRLLVATPEEVAQHGGPERFASHVSLDHELRTWARALAAIEGELCRLREFQIGLSSADNAASLSEDKAYMASMFKLGKIRLLNENAARIKHFMKVSKELGQVTTVWVAPEVDVLKTVFYDIPVTKYW